MSVKTNLLYLAKRIVLATVFTEETAFALQHVKTSTKCTGLGLPHKSSLFFSSRVCIATIATQILFASYQVLKHINMYIKIQPTYVFENIIDLKHCSSVHAACAVIPYSWCCSEQRTQSHYDYIVLNPADLIYIDAKLLFASCFDDCLHTGTSRHSSNIETGQK